MPLMSLHRLALPATALAAVLAAPVLVNAEGTELKFRLGLRAETESNPKLGDPRGSADSLGLTFGVDLVRETAASRLAFTASGLVLSETGAGARDDGLADPVAELSYNRAVADADLNASLRHARTSLDRTEPTDFEDGTTGERRSSKISAGINWGRTGPLGFGLNGSAEDIDYIDAPGSDDRRTHRLGATVRGDLSKVLQLSFGLSTYQYRPDGAPRRDTNTVTSALTLVRPTGSMSLNASVDDTEDGTRESLSFGHNIEFLTGDFSWSLGATQGVTGKTSLSGDLGWSQDMAHGTWGLTLSRAVASSDTTDKETLQDRVAINWRQDVTEHGRLSLAASWGETTDELADVTTTNTQLSATWSHELPQDWALDAGYTKRIRDRSTSGRADSDRVFLELRRDFTTRF